MKSPDEIKKAFECCMQMHGCKECSYSGERCTVELSKDALTLIQQLEAAQPKWISVEERLPEESGCVLCVIKNGWGPAVTEGYFWKGDQYISPIDEDYSFEDVTHWMPMPELPKGSE